MADKPKVSDMLALPEAPPEPPVLTMRQKQKRHHENLKLYGHPITKTAPQRRGKAVVGR